MNTQNLKLVDEKTGKEVKVGDRVTTFRGDKGILKGWKEPYDFKENALRGGKVYVQVEGDTFTCEWYPQVICTKFVE